MAKALRAAWRTFEIGLGFALVLVLSYDNFDLLSAAFQRAALLRDEAVREAQNTRLAAVRMIHHRFERGPQRWALLVNGDSEERHLQNIPAYQAHLEKRFGVPAEHIFIESDLAGLLRAFDALNRYLSPEDTLFVYTTGHGILMGRPALALRRKGYITGRDFAVKLLLLPAARIHYFGDQCLSGTFAKELTENFPKKRKDVLAFSATGPMTDGACEDFTPPLLAAYAGGASDRSAFERARWEAGQAEPEDHAELAVFKANGPVDWADKMRLDTVKPQTPPPQGPSALAEAPDFTWPDVYEGEKYSLSDFPGYVVLVDFWATWCPPCRAELPHLARLHNKYMRDGFAVIGIAHKEDEDEIKDVAAENAITYPLLVASGDTQGYQHRYLPTAFLVGCDRKVLKRYTGYTEPDVLEKDVQAALESCGKGEPPAPNAVVLY